MVSAEQHDNGSLCYEEHNGVIEIGLDAKIVPTFSFEEIRNQIEEKWKEEIKTKMAEVSFVFWNFLSTSCSDPGEEGSGAESAQQQDRVCPAHSREREGDDSGGRIFPQFLSEIFPSFLLARRSTRTKCTPSTS